MECAGGEELPTTKFMQCEYMPVKSLPFAVICALLLALAIMILVSMTLVAIYRGIPIIRRSQLKFLETMLLGSFCICAAAIIYAGKPNDLLYAARPTLLSIGFTLIFGSFVVKSLRVYRVFMSKKTKRVVLTAATMFKILGAFLLVDVLVLFVWFAADFPSAEDVEYRADAVFYGVILSSKMCSSSSFIYSALLIFWKAILVCSGLYLSFLERNVSLDFQESFWVFESPIVVGFGCALLLPLAYMVTIAVTSFYIFLGTIMWLYTLLVVVMMLTPKVLRYKKTASDPCVISDTRVSSMTAVNREPNLSALECHV